MKKRVLLSILFFVALVLVLVSVSRWSQLIQGTSQFLSPLTGSGSSGQYSTLPDPPPHRDLYALTLALRPDVKGPIPRVVNKETPQYSLGQKQVFSLTDLEKDRHFKASTTLRHVSPHAYFYVEDGVGLSDEEIRRGADDFENTVFASDRKYFGAEWLPGVDNDPRLTIVMANIPGVAGYYSSADEYPKAVNPFSNEREIIYISLLGLRPGTRDFAAVLSHEFEHAIHWNEQPQQETWISEGMAELASSLAGFNPSSVSSFQRSPDIQLTGWSDDSSGIHRYYGGAYLFMKYLFQHYGGYESIKDFLAEREPGARGVTAYLKKKGYGVDFDGVFKDWVVANYLDESGSGRYSYPDDGVKVTVDGTIKGPGETNGSVNQYGTDYYEIDIPAGDVTLSFDGAPDAKLVATDPHSGKFQWWGNRGDSIDSRLTREVDLTRLSAATLKFWAWYDIENMWDFAYVEVSSDGGATWETIAGQYTTKDDPLGTSFGNGLTGRSGSRGPVWTEETMDLSPYVGKKVMLRFEYITDEALNKPGIAIDDITIPELGFKDDAENDAGWKVEGFVRTTNLLHQRYLVQVIRIGDRDNGVETMALDAGQDGRMVIRGFGKDFQRAVLAISGLTPATSEIAPYRFSLSVNR